MEAPSSTSDGVGKENQITHVQNECVIKPRSGLIWTEGSCENNLHFFSVLILVSLSINIAGIPPFWYLLASPMYTTIKFLAHLPNRNLKRQRTKRNEKNP